jgi:hypothetical protein
MSLREDVWKAQRDGHSLQRYNVIQTIAGHLAHPLLVRLPSATTVRCADILAVVGLDAAAPDTAGGASVTDADEIVRRTRLGARSEVSAATAVNALREDEVRSLLLRWGVDEPGDAANSPDVRRCLWAVVGRDFWRQNYELHPQWRRVRNWMWVHDRYRSQAYELRRRCQAPGLTASSVTELRRLFMSFARKIDGHHRFEEKVLFPWLRNEQTAASVGAAPELAGALEQRLEPQHEQITGRLRSSGKKTTMRV